MIVVGGVILTRGNCEIMYTKDGTRYYIDNSPSGCRWNCKRSEQNTDADDQQGDRSYTITVTAVAWNQFGKEQVNDRS